MKLRRCDKCKQEKGEQGRGDWGYKYESDLCPACFWGFKNLEDRLYKALYNELEAYCKGVKDD